MLKIYCFVLCIAFLDATKVPFITPCKSNDSPCIISSASSALENLWRGVPELGVPILDPLEIGSLRNDDKDLKLGFRNMKVFGSSKCKFLDIKRELYNSTIALNLECPLRATGQYDLKGKMLFIEAFGDGDFDIKTNRVLIYLTAKFTTIESAGVKHWKITSFDYSYDLAEKVDIGLHNLFGGDETRAKPILEVINHNWKEMVIEIGGPIIKQLLDKSIHIVNKFFSAVPVDNLEIV
ncbi:circadian clock-controlled protein daywake isoform X3 [Pieris rapae]|uniref:circadian clock-controlled protein daywake isoform X3 n=1 Tax=Pieris rapae TaxID=64459 RepID=UPI001E27B12A|nr:circadian clock-controlled protein daywake isoform X3 [Pieris rapae]